MHQFRDKSLAQRELVSAGLLLYPVLRPPTCSPTAPHEVPVGEDQREHLELMRDVARRFNARFGDGERCSSCPSTASRRSARGSWTCRTRPARCPRPAAASRAPCTCSTSPRRSRRSSSARSPTPAARSAAAPEKPGITNLIDILAAVRGSDPAAIEREFADGPLRRVQGGRRRGRDRLPGAGARALRASCAPTRPALEAILARGRRAGAGDRRRRRSPTCASAMGVGAPRGARRAPPCAGDGARTVPARERSPPSSSTSTSSAGPFDLLLTLVLREEVDLLELALAEVVLAYLDHLERAASSTSRRRPSSSC